jgi:hypothetical protein
MDRKNYIKYAPVKEIQEYACPHPQHQRKIKHQRPFLISLFTGYTAPVGKQ